MAWDGPRYRIPLGQLGLVGTANFARVPPQALIRAEDIRYVRGGIGRAGGSVKYNGTPISGSPKVQALLDWHPTPSIQRLFAATSDGKLLRDDGGGSFGTTLASGLGGGVPQWATGGGEQLARARKAFFCNGLNSPRVVSGDGATATAIAKPAADWGLTGRQPTFMRGRHNRMWALAGDWLYGSTIADHEDFQTSADIVFFPIGPGQGVECLAFAELKTLVWVLKYPQGIYIFDDTDVDPSNWLVREHTLAVGICGPNALAVTDDDVYFLDAVGHVRSLANIRNFNVEASDLTAAYDLIDQTKALVDTSADGLRHAQAVFYSQLQEVHFAVRGKGQTTNNLRIVLDVRDPQNVRFKFELKDTCEALALRQDTGQVLRLTSGDAAGTVWLLDDPSFSKAGAAYQTLFQTPHDDFSSDDQALASRDKNLAWLELEGIPTGTYAVSIDVYLDGIFRYTVSMPLASGSGGAILGVNTILGSTFILGTTATINSARRRLYGSGRRASFLVRINGAGQDFLLSDLVIGYTPGGERAIA